MAYDYPIEALLRPKHEYYSAFVHAVCACVFLLFPWYLEIGHFFAAVCGVRAVQRYFQGRHVAKYQASLWRYKSLKMKRKRLPVSTNRLYLGNGFKWKQMHTQRLADIDVQSHYGETPKWYTRAHDLKFKFENSRFLSKAIQPLYTPSIFNPLRPSLPPNDSGSVCMHALGAPEGYQSIYLADKQRTGHMAIFGTTGVGKTVLMNMLAQQDIAAGHVTIILDPKGDAALLAGAFDEAVRSGRDKDFHFFHLGFPEASSGYSPIGTFSRVTEVASRLASLLPGDGQSLAFREFVWRLINVIARTMTALGKKIDVEDIGKYGQNIDPLAEEYLTQTLNTLNHRDGAWEAEIKETMTKRKTSRVHALCHYFQTHNIEDSLADTLIYYVQYDRSHLEKLTGSLLPLIDKLTTGKIAELLAPNYGDGSRRVFSWPEVIRSGGVVYVGFDSLTDPEVSSAVGNSMFSDLTSTLGDIYKHASNRDEIKICVYADEFAELVGPTFVQLLNKGRGAGLRITTGAQTVEDLIVGFGDKDKAGQALGNYNSMYSLRSKNEATAELLTNQMRDAVIHSLMVVSSARDEADTESNKHFTSTNEQRVTTERVPVIEPAHVASLPPGEGFAYIDGGTLYKTKIPLIEQETDTASSDVEAIVRMIQLHQEKQTGRKAPTTVPVNISSPVPRIPEPA